MKIKIRKRKEKNSVSNRLMLFGKVIKSLIDLGEKLLAFTFSFDLDFIRRHWELVL